MPISRPPRPGSRSQLAGFALCAAAVLLAPADAPAQTIEYLLQPASQIRRLCADCPTANERTAEDLQGTFELTVMPIPEAYTIEAITAVDWRSASFHVTGAGFLERLGRDRISMVIDAVVNDQPVLLTSTAHPVESGGSLRLSLSSAPDSPVAVEIDLLAMANATDGPDADRDGLPDVLDLCPRVADGRQADSDLDGVGDSCDACPDTAFGDPVLENGCSVDQACPCAGPRTGLSWRNQKEYVTCVARALKILAEAEEVTREQARRMVQAAINSGCGMPIIARADRAADHFFFLEVPPYPDVDSTADSVALFR